MTFDRESFAAQVRQRVPAYRTYLEAHGAPLEGGWDALPLTNKHDYLLAFPLESMCWDGSLAGCHFIGASSGFSQSGTVYWPKRPQDERGYLESVEHDLIDKYGIDRRRTLVLVCLAFGTWIGGMQLASALRSLALQAKHPLTLSTPGLNLAEAVDIYARFADHYEQVLWITNPSNINIIAALMELRGLPLACGTCFFPVVGEYFTEGFRESVAARFGHAPDSPFCVWTGYGSADAGALGAETAATIALRKFFHARPALSRRYFGSEDVPMLLQSASNILLEELDGSLVVTKDQSVPLVRYNTGDAGGLLPSERLRDVSELPPDLRDALPDQILYVRGRASDQVIFYGTNLMMSTLNHYLLSLPDGFRYGGLFEVRRADLSGVTGFAFRVFVRGQPDEDLRARYEESLLGFLKDQSLEFRNKYEALSRSVGEPLIRVELRDVVEVAAEVKHRYIVEV